jgi:creatinine amidohydrolase/Fe(II)-dependent formamide hydrolase-like protein
VHLAKHLGGVVLPACHLSGVHEPILESPQSDRELFQRIGNFYLRPETFRALLEDTVDGLLHIGFKMVVLYSGHYPRLQIAILDEVAARKTFPGKTFVYSFFEPRCFNAGDHAGKWETSLYIALGYEPRMDAIKPEQGDVLGFWFKFSPPTDASRGFGEQALTKLVEFFRAQIAENLPK